MKTELRWCEKCGRKTIQAQQKASLNFGFTWYSVWYCPQCGLHWERKERIEASEELHKDMVIRFC